MVAHSAKVWVRLWLLTTFPMCQWISTSVGQGEQYIFFASCNFFFRFDTKALSRQNMRKEFVDVLNNHRGLIYKVCHLYCDDPEDRKDLFQEIVLQVWKSLGNFRQESSIGTWMYRIALNTAITHLRKEKRSGGKVSLDGIDIPELNEDSEKEEQLKQLFKAIENLDRIDKSVILLHLEEKSYEEISEITGLTRTNVGVRLNRIKAKLSNTITNR